MNWQADRLLQGMWASPTLQRASSFKTMEEGRIHSPPPWAKTSTSPALELETSALLVPRGIQTQTGVLRTLDTNLHHWFLGSPACRKQTVGEFPLRLHGNEPNDYP